MLGGIALAATAVAVAFVALNTLASPPRASADPPSAPVHAAPPSWPAGPPGLTNRLAAAGLPALQTEGTVLHTHQHLDIYVNGSPVVVPAEIGIDRKAGVISPLHTHDATGVLHVESPTVRDFTLGEFFDVWGVRFSADCLADSCAGSGEQLRVFVNGTRVTGDPRQVKLEPEGEIVVAFGKPEQLPAPVPGGYAFPQGL